MMNPLLSLSGGIGSALLHRALARAGYDELIADP